MFGHFFRSRIRQVDISSYLPIIQCVKANHEVDKLAKSRSFILFNDNLLDSERAHGQPAVGGEQRHSHREAAGSRRQTRGYSQTVRALYQRGLV